MTSELEAARARHAEAVRKLDEMMARHAPIRAELRRRRDALYRQRQYAMTAAMVFSFGWVAAAAVGGLAVLAKSAF